MALVDEIAVSFDTLRSQIKVQYDPRAYENQKDKAEAQQACATLLAALDIGESVVRSLKYIADSLHQINLNTQPKG